MNDGDSRNSVGESLPLISIIIPVYNLYAYLEECLESIQRQSFRNIEIIAVEGASTDGTDAILAKRSNLDPPITVISLSSNVPGQHVGPGPGLARNIGIARAKGAYVWFVDGDDSIVPDRLADIAGRLSSDRPDVLLIGHEEIAPDGRASDGYGLEILRRQAKPTVTLADSPELAELRMVSWNKIVRREFLLSTGAVFLEQWPHEDIPVSCAVLAEARSIAVLPAACYRYRSDRPGSAMNAGSAARHFTVFAAWDKALSHALRLRRSGDPAVTADVYRALFERAVWHCSNLFDTRGYLARGDRRRYFAAMHDLFTRFAPDGYREPAGFRGRKFSLIRRNAYVGYSALAPVNAARVRLSKMLAASRGRIGPVARRA